MLHELILMAAVLQSTPSLKRDSLQKDLEKIVAETDGRVGICAKVIESSERFCVNGDQKFPMQSVMKMVVGLAVLDGVDQKKLRLADSIVVKPEHASPGPQEFADLVRKKGSQKATVEDLLRRAVVDSDSTSIDVLIERIGGITVVQDYLQRKKLDGIRIDRNERDLQAESVGLSWQAQYADSKTFEEAVKALPESVRNQAAEKYLKDPRDTAVPSRMVDLLTSLAKGELLSAESTKVLLRMMGDTATGADRLKAGLPKGWTVLHKTGTGRVWKEMTATTNDVGLLQTPQGRHVAIAVFVSESKRSNQERAGVIAKVARAVTSAYQP